MKAYKVVLFLGLITASISGYSAAIGGAYDRLPESTKRSVNKLLKHLGDGYNRDIVAVQYERIRSEKIKLPQIRDALYGESAHHTAGEDLLRRYPEFRSAIDMRRMRPGTLGKLVSSYSDFEAKDEEERKGILWIEIATCKGVCKPKRNFSELGDFGEDLLKHAQEKGILPHRFGEWFDELPAGDANAKAIHLLTKVMGLRDILAAEVMAAGLSYDDYESMVDIFGSAADPVTALHEEIKRRSSAAAEARGEAAIVKIQAIARGRAVRRDIAKKKLKTIKARAFFIGAIQSPLRYRSGIRKRSLEEVVKDLPEYFRDAILGKADGISKMYRFSWLTEQYTGTSEQLLEAYKKIPISHDMDMVFFRAINYLSKPRLDASRVRGNQAYLYLKRIVEENKATERALKREKLRKQREKIRAEEETKRLAEEKAARRLQSGVRHFIARVRAAAAAAPVDPIAGATGEERERLERQAVLLRTALKPGTIEVYRKYAKNGRARQTREVRKFLIG